MLLCAMSRPQERAVKRETDEMREGEPAPGGQPRKKHSVRRKVNMACIYCRRSHMTCDENRPCRRCVKRDIGHLCRDEAASPAVTASARNSASRTQPRYKNITAIQPQVTLHMPARPDLLTDLGTQGLVLDPTHTHLQQSAHAPAFASSEAIASLSMPTLASGEHPAPFAMSPSFASTSPQELSLLPPSQGNPDISLSHPPLSASNDVEIPSSVAPSATHATPGQNNTPAERTDSSLFHGTPLGGAGWLGLGGSAHRSITTGDSGGGGEFNTLSEFLESLDDNSWYLHKGAAPDAAPNASEPISFPYEPSLGQPSRDPLAADPCVSLVTPRSKPEDSQTTPYSSSFAGTKTERFLLTAADQTDGSRDERLRKVIQAKYEAGLLRPYNHVNGYARLNRWMEQNVSASSRKRILKPLSVFRPVFYSVAKNLTHFDLIYIEEAFERLLLDYDRVFSIQGIPACLWRRTGEIYKGNKEFAELVGVPIEYLREGRLCIYELMAEESAVNYWEKFGAVSFDPTQKAVLTMCKLRSKNRSLQRANTASQQRGGSEGTSGAKYHAKYHAKDHAEEPSASAPTNETANTGDHGDNGSHDQPVKQTENVPIGNNASATAPDASSSQSSLSSSSAEAQQATYITCCFSFTIRRDKWNVRTC